MGMKKYVHEIGVDPLKCGRCHTEVTKGDHSFTQIPENVKFLCSQCHSENSIIPPDIKGKPPKVIPAKDEDNTIIFHLPFKEGRCTVCHDAHESDYHSHLKKYYPPDPYAVYSSGTYSLCANIQCHKGYEKALEEPRVLRGTMFRNGNLNLHFKHVNKKKGRTCLTCHKQHGSKVPGLIADNFHFGTRTLTLEYEKTTTGGSCRTSCHRDTKYDRYTPAANLIVSSPTPGQDATAEELKLSRERDASEEGESEETQNIE
jgi:predicted CXXCH cytochrome family protein